MNLNGGYAMIKFNSTKEELAIAYKSKRPALFYDENQRAHWAVIEETATQSVNEETQEPITLYEYSYKLLNDIEALVDSNGNNRFIGGNGTPLNVSGMTIVSSKWTLNGNNLIFEFLGTFSESLSSNTDLCMFTLPEWIISKIPTPYLNIVDFIRFDAVYTDRAPATGFIQIYKSENTIAFKNQDSVTIEALTVFKIRYNIIIDNE